MTADTKAFTCFYLSHSLVLANQVKVLADGRSLEVPAVWDTGATRTCVSMLLADKLGLESRGTSTAVTPSGRDVFPSFLVNLELPNGVTVTDLKVTGTQIHKQRIGVLIGMDVITQGDFAVSCKGGKTQFTFRMPSIEDADYTISSSVMGTSVDKGD